jgi:uracil-DNA glycosylase family 4
LDLSYDAKGLIMEGFFSKKETESMSRPDGKTYSCVSCGLYKSCNSPKLAVAGRFKRGILNIGSRPSESDDEAKKPFQSKSGKYLEQVYKDLGIDLWEDCLNTFAVKCSTKKEPSAYQIDCCRRHLLKVIEEYKPKVIVLFGNSPLYSVIGNRWKRDLGTVEKWRGFVIPDQDFKAFIIPTFDPLDAKESVGGVIDVIWKQDLAKVLQYSETMFPKYKEPEIIYLENDLSVLDKVVSGHIAFDYETTGIKPHGVGHRIICASVAISEAKVYTFMIPETRRAIKPFTDLLQRKTVGKFAQNMKFEDTWTNVRLKVPVVNWTYDTMLASHIIENRPGVTGLKFQTYVQFGVVDYESEVSNYLKAEDNTNANSINKIEELLEKPNGTASLLKYCALDSIFEYRLAMLTRKSMLGIQGQTEISPLNSNFPAAYHLLHAGTLALAKAERQGLRVDVTYADNMKDRLTTKIGILERKIYESAFYKQWQHTIKGKVNLNSGVSLGNFLYGVKRLTPAKLTENGKGSTDEEALRMLRIPELDMILERSKLQKVRDTYLDAFLREQVKGVLHPFFNLHLARTYRSSSNNPNFQNIPKRDKVAMQTVRKAIYPRIGHQLLEMDFSGIEVAIAACYHKDPTMIKYITDPTSDMHGDMAKQIFKITNWDRKRKDHSMLRAAAKNGFVFPQFYGDYYANCAANICSSWVQLPKTNWKGTEGVLLDDGTPISKHLISQGIKSYEQFLDYIKRIEKDFWTVRFPVYAKWKDSHYEQYQKTGYVSLKTGFVCKGVMGRNDVINYPVQGAAFHCLLWLFIRLTERLEELNYKTRLVGQIHDAVVLDVFPNELVAVYQLIRTIAIEELPQAFTWINVPLEIDAELCPVDGSWALKESWKPVLEDLPF